MNLPPAVVICECFARDGLQSEDQFVPTDLKVRFVDAATEAGFPKIEAASYAHPKYLPQFADTEEVLRRIRRRPGVVYLGLVPNEKGLDRCLDGSVGGVGGRPKFTEGSYPRIMGFTGNACAEDLVAMFEEMGVRTGIDLDRLLELGQLAERILGRELNSHVVKTGLVKH